MWIATRPPFLPDPAFALSQRCLQRALLRPSSTGLSWSHTVGWINSLRRGVFPVFGESGTQTTSPWCPRGTGVCGKMAYTSIQVCYPCAAEPAYVSSSPWILNLKNLGWTRLVDSRVRLPLAQELRSRFQPRPVFSQILTSLSLPLVRPLWTRLQFRRSTVLRGWVRGY